MYKGINELKKGYQPLAYVIKEDDSTIIADTISIIKVDRNSSIVIY